MTTTWLETLGNAVLHHLWQMGLLYLLYRWLCAGRVKTPAGRHKLALSFQLLALLLFAANLLWQPAGVVYPGIAKPQVFAPQLLQLLYRLLGVGYGFFTAVALGRQIMAWQQLSRLGSLQAQKAPLQWRLFVQKHADWLQVKKEVTIRLCAKTVPVTFGWLKPVILLPVACINGLTNSQVEAILLHELAHIKRADFFWNMVLQVTHVLLYFNPFCRLLQQDALNCAEKACDDWVLQFGYNPAEYSEALLKIARMGHIAPAYSLAATGKKNSGLYLRIHRMLTGMENNRPSWKMHVAAAAMVVLVWALGMPLPKHRVSATASANAYKLLQQRYSRFTKPAIAANPVTADAAFQKAKPENSQAAVSLISNATANPKNKTKLTKNQTTPATATDWLATQQVNMTPLFLNTGNLETIKEESPELHRSNGMPAFEQLLEKLETTHSLENEEWEELVMLIDYYTELKKALLMAYQKQQNGPEMRYAKDAFTPKTKEILMIVFDEKAGTLAATGVEVRSLPLVIQEDLAGTPGKQVLLVKKKAPRGKVVDL